MLSAKRGLMQTLASSSCIIFMSTYIIYITAVIIKLTKFNKRQELRESMNMCTGRRDMNENGTKHPTIYRSKIKPKPRHIPSTYGDLSRNRKP